MNNIEALKQELLLQKELIEKRGGYVVVAGSNPSPSEITAGIETVAGSDLTIATATEEDVRLGKTFYSGTTELKTGSAIMDTESIHHIFMANKARTTEDVLYYTFPSFVTELREGTFENNYNNVTITFNNELTKICQYAFSGATYFSFTNMSELTNLKTISQYAFRGCHCNGIDFGSLPNSITQIDQNAFENSIKTYQNLKLPENLKSLGQSAFKQSARIQMNIFDCSNTKLTVLANSICYNLAFNCDLIVPTNITTISQYFNYNGCFKNIVIHDNVTIGNYAFGGAYLQSPSDFYLQTVVFQGETPPSVGSSIFADQNITNGFKIYVPDNSVEAYKAVTNLAKYADCIYPISQKE